MNSRLLNLLKNNASGRALDVTRSEAGLEVSIYDVIDPWYGVSAAGFQAAIKDGGSQPLTIRLNSPGGDVFEGRAIASQIRAYVGPTRVIVDGLAASSASTIAMAAQTLDMAQGSFLMVHDSWTIMVGNAGELRKFADVLEKIDGEIAADYAARAGVTPAQARAWMKDETWFTATEAVDAKLANSVLEQPATQNSFNLAAFDKTPKALLSPPPEPGPTPEQIRASLERRLRLF